MRTAVIGGTFDPVHLGHLHLLHSVIQLTDYERIIIIPTAIPPHKADEPSVSSEERLAMMELALLDYPRLYPNDRSAHVLIDTCEINRGGISYMFDTVNELYQRYEIDGKIGMVIGDDLVAGLRRWYRFERLRHLVEFIILRREHAEHFPMLPPGVVGTFLENPILIDSSTQVRALLASGKATEAQLATLVSKSVMNYIMEHGLYQT